MNAVQLGLLLVWVPFTALSGLALWQHGIVGLVEALTANTATVTLVVDLMISLTLIMTWMWADARERGLSALPYLILTAVLGSVGSLLYLVRRAAVPHRVARPVVTAS